MLDFVKKCFSSLLDIPRKKLNNFSCCKTKKPKKFVFKNSSSLTSTHQLRQVFEFIDTNGDGKISPVELGQILLSLGHDKSSATKEAEYMVREMDCDGDGLVDFEEFMTVMMTSAEDIKGVDSAKDGELLEAFLIFDADKNGFISAEELQRVLMSLGCKNCSLKECSCMIKGVDKDGDGRVDFEEFKSMMRMRDEECLRI